MFKGMQGSLNITIRELKYSRCQQDIKTSHLQSREDWGQRLNTLLDMIIPS